MTYPPSTATGDYSSRSSRDKAYRPPQPAEGGQPDSAAGLTDGGHRPSRRNGPLRRLLHRRQPENVPPGAHWAETRQTRGASAPPDNRDSGSPADTAGAPESPADPAAAKPGGAGPAARPAGYRAQHRASRAEQAGISWASARPAPGQLGAEEVNERFDPDQAAREHLAAFRPDEERVPGGPGDADRGWLGSPMPPFPGSARSRAAVPAPLAAWVAGRADGPGRPVNATGSSPGRPVPPVPGDSAPPFVMPAPTFASSAASAASGPAAAPPAPPAPSYAGPLARQGGSPGGSDGPDGPEKDGDPLYRVLAGLALRDLTLVESLLQVVEKLESHEEDAEQLELLFRIDHLATRMRRNSENLLVLAGHDGEGRDFEPVPLLDVVRAAVSEINEYNRAQIAALPDVQVAGRPADDVSHILAELLDNATSKSPESAVVVVRAERTGDGTMVLTVEDSGIGIPADQLADINIRLGRPPVLEAAATRHMGLYVVGRLAQRHGIRVQLRERPYGGIAAHVILPRGLVQGRPETPAQNGRGGTVRSALRAGTPPVPGPGTVPAPAPASDRPQAGPAAPPLTPTFAPADPKTLPRRNLGQPKAPAPGDGVTGGEPNGAAPAGQARASQIRADLAGFQLGQRAARKSEPPELHHNGEPGPGGPETDDEPASPETGSRTSAETDEA